jgi:hypothetical protein
MQRICNSEVQQGESNASTAASINAITLQSLERRLIAVIASQGVLG